MSIYKDPVSEMLVDVGRRIHMKYKVEAGLNGPPDFDMVPNLTTYYGKVARSGTNPFGGPFTARLPVAARIDPHEISTIADQRGQDECTLFLETQYPGTIVFGEEPRRVWNNAVRDPTEREDGLFKQREIQFYRGERKGISWLCDSLDGTLLYRFGGTDFAIMLGRYEGDRITDMWVHYPAREQGRERRRTIYADVGKKEIYVDNRLTFRQAADNVASRLSVIVHFNENLPESNKDEIRKQLTNALNTNIRLVVEEYHIAPSILRYAGKTYNDTPASAVVLWSQGITGDKTRNWSGKPWDTMPYVALTKAFGGVHGDPLTGKPYAMVHEGWTNLREPYPEQPFVFARSANIWNNVAGAVNQVRNELR